MDLSGLCTQTNKITLKTSDVFLNGHNDTLLYEAKLALHLFKVSSHQIVFSIFWMFEGKFRALK
jgi:hypothetical protein